MSPLSGLCPPMAITKQERAPETDPQANLMESIPQSGFPLLGCVYDCVELTETDNKLTF